MITSTAQTSRKKASEKAAPLTRCAIYTRKSTEEGLEQEYNTLDAQRDSGEAYIRAQLHEGWEIVPDRYDDGGFTGGNMDRPALRRLLADIEAGKVDCVLVYKVDRLSRSLLDFSRMLETFEKFKVAFVSVTQQFNTANSMGRLMLNVLLSFAQFEREIISERTRDKIAAARRKGKWSGGLPILGYDVDPKGSKLLLNEAEAERVRTMYDLYLKSDGMLSVVTALDLRGWRNKEWTTRSGKVRGGRPFTKTSLYKLLTNVTYVGQLRYKDEIHPGEHAGIVTPEVWQQVQTDLQQRGRGGTARGKNQFGALLKGLLRCSACKTAMTPSHSTRAGKRYRYYLCGHAQKKGWKTCPSPSLPAHEIEQFVVNQIRSLGREPLLIAQILAQAEQQVQGQRWNLESELKSQVRDLAHWNAEVRDLIAHVGPGGHTPDQVDRLADLQHRIQQGEHRERAIRDELTELSTTGFTRTEATAVLAKFDPVWEVLTPREQSRVIELLVAQVDYDGVQGKVAVTFHPHGFEQLGTTFDSQKGEG